MPTTPNRAYPYPAPSDPNDVPGDLEAFARAVDADLTALAVRAGARPQARVSAQTTVSATGEVVVLPWESVDYNVRDAIRPLSGSGGEVVINQPGFYYLFADFDYQSISNTHDYVGARLQAFNGIFSSTIAEVATPFVTLAQGTRNMDLSGMHPFNAGHRVSLFGLMDQTVPQPSLFGRRSLTLLRMTETP
ncbi:MAG TPA: hypothetical protein VF049_22195 [Nocardioidaceae bacterium]